MLSAFNTRRELVLEESLAIDDYYENSHSMIDDNDFRKQYNIRFVRGCIYDYDGNLDQEFDNEYDDGGTYIRSRIVHADGTVIDS